MSLSDLRQRIDWFDEKISAVKLLGAKKLEEVQSFIVSEGSISKSLGADLNGPDEVIVKWHGFTFYVVNDYKHLISPDIILIEEKEEFGGIKTFHELKRYRFDKLGNLEGDEYSDAFPFGYHVLLFISRHIGDCIQGKSSQKPRP